MASSTTEVTATVDTLDERRLDLLARIEQRVLWLAVRIVDYANRERPNEDELKVGGHQASSASMVSLMTALYVADLEAADRVSVKPHASPVLHAIEYLLAHPEEADRMGRAGRALVEKRHRLTSYVESLAAILRREDVPSASLVPGR